MAPKLAQDGILGRMESFAGCSGTCLACPRHNTEQRANITTLLQQRTIPAAVNITRGYAADTKAAPTEVSSILEQRIRGVQEETGLAETGRVLTVGYGETAICEGMKNSG